MTKDMRTRFCSKECLSSHISSRRKNELSLLSKEEKSAWGKRAEAKGRQAADEVRKAVKENTELGLAIKEKISQGVKDNWDNLPEDVRNNRVAQLQINAWRTSRSDISKDIKAALVRNGIHGFESEQIFKGKIPDEINHEKKLIIEIFGDYFHANPAIYEDDAYLSLFKCTAKERRLKDEEKIKLYEEAGYKTYIIWESTYNTDAAQVIQDVIQWVNDNS